jgi:hypothetical protein
VIPGSWRGTGVVRDASWSTLPQAPQLQILEHIPLLQLAQMACLCKGMLAGYVARKALRQAVISSLPRVADGSTGSRPISLGDLLAYRPRLSTALPRDLVGVPEVRACSPSHALGVHFSQKWSKSHAVQVPFHLWLAADFCALLWFYPPTLK